MFKGKSILAVIPARGGSKGVPRKNVRPLGGRPLIAWVIEAARSSRYLDGLILSSDDREIIETAGRYGCPAPFVRPTELATDEIGSAPAFVHAIENFVRHDYTLLLQATSPLVLPEDIDTAIAMCIERNAPGCVSVSEPHKSPYWMYNLNMNGVMEPLFPGELQRTRRQALPAVYIPNGAIYLTGTQRFLDTRDFYSGSLGYIMPPERSLDVDTELDFLLLEALLKSQGRLLDE